MHSLLITAISQYALISAAHSAHLYDLGDHDHLVFLSRCASVVLLALYCLYQLFRQTHSCRFRGVVQNENNVRFMRKVPSTVATALLLYTVYATKVLSLPMLDAVTSSTASLGDSVPSQAFFSFCLLPMLAEFAEFGQTCSLAYRGDMGISFEVATATSIHMMLLIAPLFCLVAWCMGDAMDLDLGSWQVTIFVFNIWVFSLVTRRGESNFLHGTTIYGL
jgi:calcium/proton exchanger cax